MRNGLAPQDACEQTIRRMLEKEQFQTNPSVNVIALDRDGRFGGAGTDDTFCFAVTTPEGSGLHSSKNLWTQQ
jgi:hypothetical protein